MLHTKPYKPFALLGVLALLSACATKPPVQPAAPYYSIEFGIEATRAGALVRLKELGEIDGLRAEGRSSGWHLRAGAWATLTEAGHALRAHGKIAQRALQVESPVPWLLADGSMVAVTARPPSPKPPPATTRAAAVVRAVQPPGPYYSIEFGQAATQEEALVRLKDLGNLENLRTEKRESGWVIRAGAWARIESAERALFANKETAERVLRVEQPVAWILADGSTVEPAGD